jgi:hypothetical protein
MYEGCQNLHAQLSHAACSKNRVLGLFLSAAVHRRCRPHRSASTLCWSRCLIVGKTPETLQANSGWSVSTWTRFYRSLHARTGLTEQTDGCLSACGRGGRRWTPLSNLVRRRYSVAFAIYDYASHLDWKMSLPESGAPTAVAILGASISTCSVAVPTRRDPTS